MIRAVTRWVALATGLCLAACVQGGGRDNADTAPAVHQVWHTVTLDFAGPPSSEDAAVNPFTDYRLDVTFSHESGRETTVRGYYAGDGAAADTGAASGAVWQAKFTPGQPGAWRWTARMVSGADAVLTGQGARVALADAAGRFTVIPSDKAAPDLAALGRIEADGHLLRAAGTGEVFWKGGTNSPENLLGYEGFDGTYRLAAQSRDGESAAPAALHAFKAHEGDYRDGDATWGGGKGKALIGGVNYLADQGLNAAYFLTLNILGDGQDVWPYREPSDRDRFDVSKLAQWDRLFSHMQERGILLHIVLQETENELMLDAGDTGRERQLYLGELVARFAHHPGLVWNLGEENGPVSWRPEGQTDAQRMTMASYLAAIDPYDHPRLLHTHAEAHDKDAILTPLLGFEDIDGLSFQVFKPSDVAGEVAKWRALSAQAGRPWVITMDEIGPWQDGAVPDAVSPDHAELIGEVLWGTFLSGGAGVEWYFGAKHAHNDLDAEDWRSRDVLWRQTARATALMRRLDPNGEMTPCGDSPVTGGIGCLIGTKSILTYLPASARTAKAPPCLGEVVAGGCLVRLPLR